MLTILSYLIFLFGAFAFTLVLYLGFLKGVKLI